jgi:MFS family permease
VSLFGMAFVTLLPAWAVDMLKGDARTNGFLQSARGVGALAAALAVASIAPRRSRGRIMMLAVAAMSIFLILYSLTRSLAASLLMLLAVGGANIAANNLANSLVQTLTPDHLRGRVMAVYMLAFFGFMPLGALLAGTAAAIVGVRLTVALGAACTLACVAVIAFVVRPLRGVQ